MTDSKRRNFILGTIASLPAAGLLSLDMPSEVEAADRPRRRHPHHDHCGADTIDTEEKRKRWRALVDYHMGQENEHDLPGVMATFSEDAEMLMNDLASTDPEGIAGGHILFGMSSEQGALANTQVIPDREYYTDDSLLIEGRVVADHVGDLLGYAPTGRRVTLYYSAIYRFDSADKLVSERIVMNWAPLAGAPA